MKAFIFDPLWNELITPDLEDQLKQAGLELIIKTDLAPLTECAELFQGDEERIVCFNPDYLGWKLPADDYKNIPSLKAILTQSTNFSWIDTSYADENNIPVCNIRNFSTESVAEWSIMMALSIARRIPELIKKDFPLDLDKDYMKYRGIELRGKTAGIVGLGHIGGAIAERCKGLGMEVIYWSPSTRENDYKRVEFNELFTQADVVFPTMALNDKSKALMTPDVLKSMKQSAILVAIEHHLFDVDTVVNMVKDGELFGFGFEAEPASFDKYEGNVWAAPAYAWATDTTMQNAMVAWVDNMTNAAKSVFPTRVN